jgi:hypothetical protein
LTDHHGIGQTAGLHTIDVIKLVNVHFHHFPVAFFAFLGIVIFALVIEDHTFVDGLHRAVAGGFLLRLVQVVVRRHKPTL